MSIHVPDKLLRAATWWMNSRWLARSLCRRHFGPIDVVRTTCLRASRTRKVNRVDYDGRTCVMELTLRPRSLRAGIANATEAARHGLNTARVLGHSRDNSRTFGLGYVISEYVEGRHPADDCPVEDLEEIARTYGALHSVTKERPVLDTREGWDMDRYLAEWNALIASHERALDVAPWLELARPAHHGYQLVHGDANPGNTVIAKDRGAVLIDLGPMHYGLAPCELVFLLLRYCNGSVERSWRLFENYRANLSRGRELFERHAAFWLAAGLLERARWRARQAEWNRRTGNSKLASKRLMDVRVTLTHVAELVEEFRGDASPAVGDVLARCKEALTPLPSG